MIVLLENEGSELVAITERGWGASLLGFLFLNDDKWISTHVIHKLLVAQTSVTTTSTKFVQSLLNENTLDMCDSYALLL